MSSSNFVFFLFMLSGPIVAMSSSNWLICWIGIELSFLGLIPLLISNNSFFSLDKESTMKYFCIQAMGSGLLMCGGMLIFLLPTQFELVSELIFLFSLLMKLGMFPLHFWVPSVVAGLSWFPVLMVLTWQKLAPFLFLSNLVENFNWLGELVLFLGGLSAIVGGFIGLNQTSIAPMLGASSITHSGWIAIGIVYGSVWTYFLIYCFSFVVLIMFFLIKDEFFCGISILSFSGLPPFVLFLGKWSVLKSSLMSSYEIWFVILPLLGSVLSLFFYLKFFYSFFLESEKSSKLKIWGFSGFSVLVFFGVMCIIFFWFDDRFSW